MGKGNLLDWACLISVILLLLKIAGLIQVSWWWVAAPVLAVLAIAGMFLFMVLVMFILAFAAKVRGDID